MSVFLSHSSKDKAFVRELASALAEGGEIEVWLDEREIAPGDNIVGKIGDGLEADFIVLVLSPDSVGSNWVKEEWTDAFWQQTNEWKTKLIPVLYRDCTIPRMLRNKKYFDLRANQPRGFREIRTFLMTQRPVVHERVNFLPMRPPLFIGREDELASLRERLREPGALVHVPGMAGKGKTTFARELAHRYQRDFESVYWLSCESSSTSSIAAELARQLGLKLEGDLPEVVRELKGICARKRCLLILDNVEDESPGELIPGGAASVLVTTRLTNLQFLRFHQPQALPLFTDKQCLEVFQKQIGEKEVARYQAECLLLFQRLDHLPIAVALSAALIREDVRYTIPGLAKQVPANVTELIHKAINALDEGPRQLLTGMAACAPEGFRLDLAAQIAGLGEDASLAMLHALVTRSLVEELDRTDRRYRLHALVRESADPNAHAEQHAEAVRVRFEKWENTWQSCKVQLPDFQVALEWAVKNAGAWAGTLAFNGYEVTRRLGRLTEALAICERMRRDSEERDDSSSLQAWLGNQALILKAWGRLDDALALHKKQEEICLRLGNQDGLQACYGNQALILKDWGRLDDALALHKKQEEICLRLGNQNSLQTCYGNQALILKNWGRLDDALALHKKQEEICLRLGNQDGLQACYGNQALILQDWGRLDDALALHKKKEDICLRLGNMSSLAICYWAWGLLERAFGNHEAEREKLSAALALFSELGMPRERDAVEAELAKSIKIREQLG